MYQEHSCISYLVVYQRKSLISFVVFICSSKLDAIKVLLPVAPIFSLYQLNGDDDDDDDASECSLCERETWRGDFCEITFAVLKMTFLQSGRMLTDQAGRK